MTSNNSRVHRIFTSSAAGSSQLDRQPHSHSASRWLKAVAVGATRLAALPSCWKNAKDSGDGNRRKALDQDVDRTIADLPHHVGFGVVPAPAHGRRIQQGLDLAIGHCIDLVR